MIAPLLLDIARCYGHECDLKESCRRFLTIEIDAPGFYSYSSDFGGDLDICDYYMQELVE